MTDPTLTPELYGTDYRNPSGLAVAKAATDAAPNPAGLDVLADRIGYVTIGYRAHIVADSASVAYWSEKDPSTTRHHHKEVIAQLRYIAEILGYKLEKADA